MIIVGAKKWLQFTSVGIIAALFSGAAVGLWRCTPSPPEPLKPFVCQEKADLRSGHDGQWVCHPPAHVEVYATGTYTENGYLISLFKCVCPSDQKITIAPIQLTFEPATLKEPELKLK